MLVDLWAYLKAVLLIPVASVGTMAGLTMNGGLEVKTVSDAVVAGLILGVLHLPVIGLLIWMWRRPERFWEHSWRTWIVLVLIVYAAGLGTALLL